MHKLLAKAEPAFKPLIKAHGLLALPTVKREAPYTALMHSIAHQQLHGNAARSILARFKGIYGGDWPEPAKLLRTRETTLRATGFSGSKIAALRDIARHALDGTVPTLAQAKKLSDDALVERLTQIRGVGRWTVEMLLIFHLARADVLPVDDFAVREGYKLMHGHDAQPKPKALWAAGTAWAPHRTLASLYFWRAADAAKRIKPAKA